MQLALHWCQTDQGIVDFWNRLPQLPCGFGSPEAQETDSGSAVGEALGCWAVVAARRGKEVNSSVQSYSYVQVAYVTHASQQSSKGTFFLQREHKRCTWNPRCLPLAGPLQGLMKTVQAWWAKGRC